MPKFDTRKVELPAVEMPNADEVRAELADRLEDVQEAVVAAPARAQEAVIDLRERYTAASTRWLIVLRSAPLTFARRSKTQS